VEKAIGFKIGLLHQVFGIGLVLSHPPGDRKDAV